MCLGNLGISWLLQAVATLFPISIQKDDLSAGDQQVEEVKWCG